MNIFNRVWKAIRNSDVYTEKEKQDHYNKGVWDTKNEDIHLRERLELDSISEMVGKQVIAFSDEWKDPLVGFCTGIEFITQAKCPVPVVENYLVDKAERTKLLIFGKIFAYTEDRFNALLKLTPAERYSLFFRYSSNYNVPMFNEHLYPGLVQTECSKVKLLTPIQAREILQNNGFYD